MGKQIGYLHRMIIDAPFGNYLNWDGYTSTIGTYTLERRAGFFKRWWRVASTVRPYPRMRAWTNKLGLPNPGIGSLNRCSGAEILSVSSRSTNGWLVLCRIAADLGPVAVELNVSCPNTPEVDTSDYSQVFEYFNTHCPCVIVKLPPVGYRPIVEKAMSRGITNFHCCNTLPTPCGGLSGKPLIPLVVEATKFCADLGASVISGGGITCVGDVGRYQGAGAQHCAIASAILNPFNWPRLKHLGRRNW